MVSQVPTALKPTADGHILLAVAGLLLTTASLLFHLTYLFDGDRLL